ncbi:PKD domain-containing protein, partial [Flavobacteriales bacterium]|nr:PKD domain-containing protein [Flavobacteriales bacterium]
LFVFFCAFLTSSIIQSQTCNDVVSSFCSITEGATTHFRFTGSEAGVSGYFWDFGDGNTSTLKNPSHTFSSTGSFQSCLTLTCTITTTTGGSGGSYGGGGGGTTTTTTCTDFSCGNISIGVYGCTDLNAINYNPLATIDDGSCRYCVYGCTDSLASNYNPLASCDDNSCLDIVSKSLYEDFESYELYDYLAFKSSLWGTWNNPLSFGCDQDVVVSSSGYQGSKGIHFKSTLPSGGPADIILPFGTSSSYSSGIFVFSAKFNVNTGAYFNFQSDYNIGSGWALDVLMDQNGQIIFSNSINSNLLTSIYPNNIWFELKLVVNITNNEWNVYIDNIFIGSFSNSINQIAALDLFPLDGHFFAVDDIHYIYNANLIYGCTDSNAFNYNLNATWDDDSCIPIILGCTDSLSLNYNTTANTDDGTCIAYIYGCTDSTMYNYNVSANTDDGTCVAYIYGCTDANACNYYSLANTDDASCNYNSSSYDTLISNINTVWNGITLMVSSDYSAILVNSDGCDSIANLNFTIINITAVEDVYDNGKTLIKIANMLGQQTLFRRNTPLFYIYNDGTIEKKIIIE